jgi:hypothetical protein
MVTSRRIPRLDRSYLGDRFRRFLPIAVRPGEGPFTEPTPAVRPRPRECVFMPLSGPNAGDRVELRAVASAAFWKVGLCAPK